MLGLMKVLWNQIGVERKGVNEERKKEDYLIRGESNKVVRWGLTMFVVVAYVTRILYYSQGYFLLTLLFGLYYVGMLHDYLFPKTLCVYTASDWTYLIHYNSDGQLIDFEPRIKALFAHNLSSPDFC